jgi:hypothetical protein
MIRNVIRELRDEGVISVDGVGRSAKWVRSVGEAVDKE